MIKLFFSSKSFRCLAANRLVQCHSMIWNRRKCLKFSIALFFIQLNFYNERVQLFVTHNSFERNGKWKNNAITLLYSTLTAHIHRTRQYFWTGLSVGRQCGVAHEYALTLATPIRNEQALCNRVPARTLWYHMRVEVEDVKSDGEPKCIFWRTASPHELLKLVLHSMCCRCVNEDSFRFFFSPPVFSQIMWNFIHSLECAVVDVMSGGVWRAKLNWNNTWLGRGKNTRENTCSAAIAYTRNVFLWSDSTAH